jgi:hypothetical protein
MNPITRRRTQVHGLQQGRDAEARAGDRPWEDLTERAVDIVQSARKGDWSRELLLRLAGDVFATLDRGQWPGESHGGAVANLCWIFSRAASEGRVPCDDADTCMQAVSALAVTVELLPHDILLGWDADHVKALQGILAEGPYRVQCAGAADLLAEVRQGETSEPQAKRQRLTRDEYAHRGVSDRFPDEGRHSHRKGKPSDRVQLEELVNKDVLDRQYWAQWERKSGRAFRVREGTIATNAALIASANQALRGLFADDTPEHEGLRKDICGFMDRTMTQWVDLEDERVADDRTVPNVGNALKAILASGAVPRDDPSLIAAIHKTCRLIHVGFVDDRGTRVISNAGNFLKALVEHGVMGRKESPDDRSATLRACAHVAHLIAQGKIDEGNPQDASNAANFLKALVEHGVFRLNERLKDRGPPGPTLSTACARMARLIDRRIDSWNPRDVSNAANFLKALLERGVMRLAERLDDADPKSSTLRSVCDHVARLIAHGKLDRGNPQALCSAANFLKALVEHGAIGQGESRDGRSLRSACGHVAHLIAQGRIDSGNPQDASNAANFLRALIERDVLSLTQRLDDANPGSPTLHTACGHVAHLIAKIDGGKPQELANAANFLKTLVERGVIGLNERLDDRNPRSPTLLTACAHVARLIARHAIDSGDAQAVASAANFLKALVERMGSSEAPDDRGPQWAALHAACGHVTHLIARGKIDGGEPQAVSNAGNFLKALVEHGVMGPQDATLRTACGHVAQLIATGGIDAGIPQAIANAANFLKAVVEHGFIGLNERLDDRNAQSPTLLTACVHVARLIAQHKIDTGDPQNISNAANLLKALVEHGAMGPDASRDERELRSACGHVARLVAQGRIDSGDPQNVANMANFLKALVEQGGTGPTQPVDDQNAQSPTLRTVCAHVAHLIVQRKVDAGDPQMISNAATFLKALVNHGVMGLDESLDERVLRGPTLNSACRHVAGLIAHGKVDTGNPQAISNAANFLRALVNHGVVEPNDVLDEGIAGRPTLRTACGRVALLIAQDHGGSPRAVSNGASFLESLIGSSIVALDDPLDPLRKAGPTLRRVCIGMTDRIADGKVADGNAKDVADAARFVLAGLSSGILEHDRAAKATTALLAAAVQVPPGMDRWSERMTSALRTLARYRIDDRPLLEKSPLLQAGEQMLQRAQAMTAQRAAERAGAFVLLAESSYAGWLDPATAWPTLNRLQESLTAQACTPQENAALVRAGTRLYRHWRQQKLPHDSPAHAGRQAFAELLVGRVSAVEYAKLQAADRAALRSLGQQAHTLHCVLGSRKGRMAHAERRATLERLLREQIGPAIVRCVRAAQRPGGFDATGLEVLLAQRHGNAALAPPIEAPLSEAQMWGLARQAHKALDGELRLMPKGEHRIAVLDSHGMPVVTNKVLAREVSLYARLFGACFGMPILVRQRRGAKASELPAFVKHEGRWYRLDVFRGSKNKPEQDEPAQLWGIPIEAAEFFSRVWLRSKEGRCYAQRAFLPEDAGPAGERLPRTHALEGKMALTLVNDARASEQVPRKSQGGLLDTVQVQDGFSLAPREWVDLLGIGGGVEMPQPSDKGLPGTALQYYRMPKAADDAKALLEEAVGHAKRVLGAPLSAGAAIPSPTALYLALTTGSRPSYSATAVPAAGDQVVLPDTKEWRQIAEGGLILGRDPYDTRNLLVIETGQVRFSAELNGAACQYTLSGYEDKPANGAAGDRAAPVTARFLKGLFMPAPVSRMYASRKDVKLHTAWDSLERKKHDQSAEQAQDIELHAGLVVKDVRRKLIAVPPKLMESLSGDFDGDRLTILPLGQSPALAAAVRAGNLKRSPNPKIPKTFTLDEGAQLDMEKHVQLQGRLTQDGASIGKLFHGLPKERRHQLSNDLAPGHILESMLGEERDPAAWQSNARLGDDFDALSPEKQNRRLLKRELEVLAKSGTDLEKTTLPYEEIDERRREIKRELANVALPYGKGLQRQLEKLQAMHGKQPHEHRRKLRELFEQLLLDMQQYDSLPNSIMRAIVSWWLGVRAPGEAATVAAMDLESPLRGQAPAQDSHRPDPPAVGIDPAAPLRDERLPMHVLVAIRQGVLHADRS